ncbi:MAG: hypothetical protein HZA66_06145 [Rhodopseudomonas palustris]|uniref:RiboL-PSP-HEPN domain-containing protein n=1 Tax=Rhodopseudomonas palustris TaxID=1076 RepID=A0A933RYW7_RHOPL|nr:hypothetical protein [Rhodopseudomonas palustris]
MANGLPLSPLEILHLYCRMLDRFFGMYLDACTGFKLHAQDMAMLAARMPSKSRVQPILFITAETNDPNDLDATYNHSETVDRIIDRNRPDGENQTLLAHSLIIFIYSIWDTQIRSAYAKSLNIAPHDVKSDAMGDLRLYRNAITHRNLKLQAPTKLFPFVDVGMVITLTSEQVNLMLSMIFDDLAQMHEGLTGERVSLIFKRPINGPT